VSKSEQGSLWTIGQFGRHIGYCQCLEHLATTVLERVSSGLHFTHSEVSHSGYKVAFSFKFL
jgi:hypothetical protein